MIFFTHFRQVYDAAQPNLILWTVLRGLDLQTGFFTFKQIKAATNNFDLTNKIGEGGFGSVYKVRKAIVLLFAHSSYFAEDTIGKKKTKQKLMIPIAGYIAWW